MADIGDLTQAQINDLGNKMGGTPGIKRYLSGERVLVDRNAVSVTVVAQDLDNGGVTYETMNVEAFLDDQAKYLKEVFRIGMPSRKKLALPPTRPGFGWGVIRLPSLSAQRMFDELTSRFKGKTWKWCQDIDKALDPTKEARNTDKGPYGIWCRARREADDELKNLSANDLALRGTNCMTEPERISLEGWFDWKTGGQHLDIKNVTLSAGSRCAGGGVPASRWSGGCGFVVLGYGAGGRDGDLRAREVVSL